MKTIYVNKKVLKEAVDYLNNEITFFGFFSHVKNFLKQLLVNPLNADIDDYLKDNNLNRKELLNLLLTRNIIEKETKIDNKNGKDKFYVSYKIPKRNFERKIRRLYTSLFETNEINESLISETDCGGAMQAGGTNPDAGQYTQPLGKVQRRKIYVTQEQSDFLKEMTTHDAGNYQYDVPLNFNNGNDPSYNHKNIITPNFENFSKKKKLGVRKKK
jgi:hypothetical protein